MKFIRGGTHVLFENIFENILGKSFFEKKMTSHVDAAAMKNPPEASAAGVAAEPSSSGASSSSSSSSSQDTTKDTSKKRSASSAASSSSKKRRTAEALGLTKEEWASVTLAPVKKKLKAWVQTLAQQVNDDWHDGWEDQINTISDWYEDIATPLQSVLDVGVKRATALLECNEILKAVSDSWYDLCACPMRGTVVGNVGDFDTDIQLRIPGQDEDSFRMGDGVHLVFSYVWTALLRVHAARKDVDASVLLQCVKDASVNNVNFSVDAEGQDLEGCALEKIDCKALNVIVAERKWAALKNTRKTHGMRRAIDRRFDGARDRRTRDYGFDDDY